jgi:hypothetical protein
MVEECRHFFEVFFQEEDGKYFLVLLKMGGGVGIGYFEGF